MLTRDRQIGRSLQNAHPDERALLDLSLRRKVKDDVIAAVLRMQPEEVDARRRAVLDRLATELNIDDEAERAKLPEVLAALPQEEWPAESAKPRAPTGAAEGRREERRPHRRRLVGVVVVGLLLGAIVGFLVWGGDSDNGSGAEKAPAKPPARKVSLAPLLPGFPGRGTASIEGTGPGARLVVRLRGLPPREDAYAVWLYNSLTDARLMYSAVGTSIDGNRRVGVDPARYRFVDVSREPIDGNPNHSGASVMRVPVARLLAGR